MKHQLSNIRDQSLVLTEQKSEKSRRPIRADGLQGLSPLPSEEQEAVLACFALLGPDTLRPVFDALDGAVPFNELHQMRLLFVASQYDSGQTSPWLIREPSGLENNLLF